MEAVKIFLGQAWSQDGVKLTLRPEVVETMGLNAPRSLCLVGMQAKANHRLGDGVDIGR
jgi:hypothetical protein